MEDYHFIYHPKQQSVFSVKIRRPVGYTNYNIHMHNQEEIIFAFSSCRVRVASNGNEITVHTPAVIINRAGSFHETLEVLDNEMDCYVCSFHPQVFTGLSSQWCCAETVFGNSNLTVLPLSERNCTELTPLFTLLTKQPEPQRRFLLLCIFDQLGRLLAEGLNPIRVSSKLTYVFEVAGLLQNMENGRELTLEQLSERFHVSQTKLKTDFKKITGMPLHAYRRHVQLQEAKILLENTQMELAQIAYSCAFNDESYFIRAFRKEYGITPGAYRKQNT